MTEDGDSRPPKIFISYSHDSKEHKAWVLQLATRLRGDGVDVTLDQWDLSLGGNLPSFMEHALTEADRILAICSDQYVAKADEGQGGVGYEKTILTGDLMKNIESKRIIPIIKNNAGKNLPAFLTSRFYADFNENANYEEAYENLLREIHHAPACPIPPIGQNPFTRKPDYSEPKLAFSSARYVSPALEGRVSFDYSNNNGFYRIGSGDLAFETRWSKASNTSIYTLSDAPSIKALALVKNISDIRKIRDAWNYDNSSRLRCPQIGQIIIWQNTAGYYCATKIEAIADDSRGAKNDSLTFSYKILENRETDFSK